MNSRPTGGTASGGAMGTGGVAPANQGKDLTSVEIGSATFELRHDRARPVLVRLADGRVADGTAVFRLTDPMQTNGASPTNALNAALVQPPLVVVPSLSEPCKED